MKSLICGFFLNLMTVIDAAVLGHLPRQSGPDIVFSGNYAIYNCGAQASQVTDILQTLWKVLLPALSDANSRTSSDAYNTFFQQVYYAPTVAGIISNITTGAAVVPGNPRHNIPASSPVITCAINPDTDPNRNNDPARHISLLTHMLAAAYTFCDEDKPAGFLGGTPMIALCPNFLEGSRAFMPQPGQCMAQFPTTNIYAEFGATFANTQVAGLLHEIVHYYANSLFPPAQPTKEYYIVGECVGLDATTAITNPASYVYYVFNIYQQCLKFPRVSSGSHGRKGLLEADNTAFPNSTVGNILITDATSVDLYNDDVDYTETADEASQSLLSLLPQ